LKQLANPQKMNKLLLIGVILLFAGIAAHYLVESDIYGFWIGALMGSGGILIITGLSKKFN
tara:strand:- start:3885 stop:4067 length:183 start_codon:yes stop_codon:yes gene_type:complete